MKLILSFLLLGATLFAEEIAPKKQDITLGLGAYVQTQPYKGADTLLLPSPVVFFDNGLFYMRWSRGGVYFYGDKGSDYAWGFSLTAQPRVYGYKPSDSPYLATLKEKKNTLEGGLAFSAIKDDAYIEIMLLTDILDRYQSWLVKTEFGDTYTLGDFSFYPSIILSYQSHDFMNYYYGVQKNETNNALGIYSYNASAGVQVGAQTYIKYPLTQELSALVNLRVDILPSSASSSPIIEQNHIYSGLASLIYTFEY